MSYRCPSCNSLILIRRLGYCPTCKEPLPDEMQLSAERIAEIDREETANREKLNRGANRGKKRRKTSPDLNELLS